MRVIGLNGIDFIVLGAIVIAVVYGVRHYKQKRLATPATPDSTIQKTAADNQIDWRFPCAVALTAFVFMLLPWLNLPILQQLNAYAPYFGWPSRTGWPMFSLFELVDILGDIRTALRLTALPVGMQSLFFLVAGWACWAVTLIMLVIGIGRSIAKKSYAPLQYNGIRIVISATLWIVGVLLANMELSSSLENLIGMHAAFLSVPLWPWLTLIAGAILIVMPKLVRR